MGPRQTTGSDSSFKSRLIDMMSMPPVLFKGRMPAASADAFSTSPLTPKTFGIEGPVMSASSTPTRWPRRAMAVARSEVTRDLPTPPLPLMTAMTRLTLLCSFGGVRRLCGSCCAPPQPPAEEQLLQPLLQFSLMMNLSFAIHIMENFSEWIGYIHYITPFS